MDKIKKEKSIISFDIENVRVYITLDDGFFNLETIAPAIHSHTRYEFHLALEGETYIETAQQRYTLRESEGYIISPGTLHTCRQDENKSIKSSFWFTFEKNRKNSSKDIFSLLSNAFESIDEVRKIENALKYIDMLKEIMHLYYSQSTFAEEKIKNLFSIVMLQLSEEFMPQNDIYENTLFGYMVSDYDEKNLRRIIIEEYINRNYQKDVTLKTLARVLHLSIKQASRVFESEFQESFKTYITKFRISISMDYLKQSDLPVVKIAHLVGYKSYNGFFKPFTKLVGVPPEEYRKTKSGCKKMPL